MYAQQCETDLNIERKAGQITDSMNDVVFSLKTDLIMSLLLSSYGNWNGKVTEVTKCLHNICDEDGSSSVNIKADSNLNGNKLHLSKVESLTIAKNICDSLLIFNWLYWFYILVQVLVWSDLDFRAKELPDMGNSLFANSVTGVKFESKESSVKTR